MTPPRFERRTGRRSKDEEDAHPDDEPVFSGVRSLQPWEVALFLGALIVSLAIWVVFIWVHRGSP